MATDKLDKIVAIPLSKIVADWEWNSRSGNPAEMGDSGGESDKNEFKSLIASIKARGQDEEVIVRPKGEKFFLVCGFRRFAAISEIAKETGDKAATIKAKVKELNDIEAKSLNIRENTARSQLNPPDLARSLVQLRTLYTAAKASPTVTAMAEEVGIGQGYASKLFAISDRVHPKVLKAWQDTPADIGVVKMSALAKLDKDRQEEAFAELIGSGKTGRGAGGGRKDWLIGAEKEAERVGAFLGRLERLGLINTANLDFGESLEYCIKMKGEDDPKAAATANQRQKLVDVITKAFEDAFNPPVEEEKPAKKAKGEKETSAN